ncbi:MAG: hypothetical protein LKI39_02380 [Bacteroides sp.]|jgi:outer membrane protein assembly factor BamB|nr:hypothetical protein [Bacteroides sp.]
MKAHKTTMLLCGIFITATLHAQSSSTVTIGTKVDGSELTATLYSLPQRVETFSISNSGDYLCINFRETTKSGKYLKNKGEIGFYDLKSKKLLWKKPINYNTTAAYCLSNGILLSTGGKTILLDKEKGEKVWETKAYPVSIDDSLGLLLGYKSIKSNVLEAINLKDGTEQWKQKIPHQYGWSQILDIEHNKRLIIADDMHKLDLKTGELLTYSGKPGAIDTQSILLLSLASVGGAMIGATMSGGTYYYNYVPTTSSNVITGLTSNILQKDSCYYWADKHQVSCLDTTLKAIWKTEFPDVKASHSRLFMQDGKLYLLNYGFGFYGGGSGRKKYGRPFIACYDPKSGKQLFFNQLSVKKDMIEDALHTKDALYMLFDDGMAYQELQDSVVNIVPWNIKEHGKLQGMLPDTLYLSDPKEKTFSPLAFDGEYCLVYNDQGKIYEINKELAISNEYPLNLIYSPCIRLKDYLCINSRNDYWFIHKLGMPVAHLNFDFRKGKVVDNKLLLLTGDNKLVFLDLDKAVQ